MEKTAEEISSNRSIQPSFRWVGKLEELRSLSLYSPGCPRTHYVDLPACIPWVLGLKIRTTMPK